MKKILTLSAAASLALMVSACTSPDNCIDDLDCGTAPYNQERTYKAGERPVVANQTAKVSAAVDETAPMAPTQVMAPAEPMPAPTVEPVRGSAEPMFDERLTK